MGSLSHLGRHLHMRNHIVLVSLASLLVLVPQAQAATVFSAAGSFGDATTWAYRSKTRRVRAVVRSSSAASASTHSTYSAKAVGPPARSRTQAHRRPSEKEASSRSTPRPATIRTPSRSRSAGGRPPGSWSSCRMRAPRSRRSRRRRSASISIFRTAGGTVGSIDESVYLQKSDSGSNFRIDSTKCQYSYNLAASSLGAGTYKVYISIGGSVAGSATLALK